MNGNLEISDPKRIRSAESPDVSETQAGAQVALAFHANWSGLPEALIPKIGLFLNKQEASRMTCVCRAFNTGITESYQIKRPLTKIRDDFKQEVGALTSDTEIPAYMYEGGRELSGHTDTVCFVTQLTDGRIVSGSRDNTLRVWDLGKSEDDDGFVQELSGHTDWVNSVTQLTDGRIVSGSTDKTLRVWGYVDPETGDAS